MRRRWRRGWGAGGFPASGDLVLIVLCTPAEFVKRLRYCEYLGKYFCDCCHSYSESCIPARILRMWDFRKYYVSNFSKRLLDHIWHEPIFNLLHVSHGLYTKAKELDRVRVSSHLSWGRESSGRKGPAAVSGRLPRLR